MKKILIFGNSGSGKSTLAKHLAEKYQLAHLDLDSLAWQASTPAERKPIQESQILINEFFEQSEQWVIEGCYSDLLELLTKHANEVIFLDIPTEMTIQNAKNRPWEPHKYKSKEAQDANLEMLIEWIKQYHSRKDVFSYSAHNAVYNSFNGLKTRITENQELINCD